MESEDYRISNQNYYNYKGNEYFTLEPNNELEYYNNIFLCPYTVNNECKYPFLRFLLINSQFNKKLLFPKITLFKGMEIDEFITYSNFYLFGLLMLTDYNNFNEKIEFNGFFEFENNLYLFYDITEYNLEIDDIYRTNNLWFTLIDEILNHRKLCDILIDNEVSDFFINNSELCFLLDKKNESYEIPIVSYVGKSENKLNFTYVFGEIRSDKNSILGPYYYFSNYHTACKNIITTNVEDKKLDRCNTKYGIVRFAVFVGNTKYFENYINDKIDESFIKSQRLQDDKLDQNMERLTMRISDHDGKWALNYDSAYLGIVELDNGKFIEKDILVLKELNQQIPLSYHYIQNYNVDDYKIF